MLFELVGTPLRRLLARALFLGVLIVGLNAVFLTASVSAAAGINQQLNFQGRLLNTQGAVVGDGYYNVEFKIYQDGTGTPVGNPGGTLKWTEDWLNGGTGTPVKVVNGYISVQLGSLTPFGSSIDWNQDTLWLSVNIGNKNNCTITTNFNTDCGGDGEMVPMKRLSAVPYALNAAKLGGLDATGFIQNNTVQQTANFNISGTGTAVTLQASTFDTAAAGVLSIGTTNASSITLAKNVTVASGKTLTLAGDTRTNINAIAAPTEGMLTYDTTNKQLLIYENGKWQADRTDVTLVAASDSSQAAKDAADFVGDGNTAAANDGDQVQINQALADANPAGTGRKTGKVYLFPGTYTIDASISMPNNTTLAGSGNATLITIPNALNGPVSGAIVNTTTGGNGTGIVIQDLRLDGNKANQTSGGSGIYLNGVGSGTGSAAVQGARIMNVQANNWFGTGIYFNASANSTVSNSTTQSNSSRGIYFSSTVNSTINGNVVEGNTTEGIRLDTSSNNNVITANNAQGNSSNIIVINSAQDTITGNVTQGGSYGIYIWLTTTSTVTGNTVQGTSLYGIHLVSATNNTVSANNLYDNGAAANNNAIYVNSSSTNIITGNIITDTSATATNYAINIFNVGSSSNYLSSNTLGTGSINDAGTGTIYGGQVNASGNYLVQPAGTIELLKNTNVTGILTATTSVLAPVLDTASAVTLNIGNTNASTISLGKTAGTTPIVLSSNSITVGIATATPANANNILGAAQTNNNTAGNAMVIQGSTGLNGNGGTLTVQAGNANGTGTLGGNLTLSGGTGSASNGTVILATSTFQTVTADTGCYVGGTEVAASCTISSNAINNNASVLVGFSADGQVATMPDPSITTAGRVVYVTASGATKDFTLRANTGAGTGIEQNIAMRKNTTATMIWNGADWTAAGASSSTTLQAAYDNTLQSAGGAELVVSKTSATNGLTIRDSSNVATAVNGTLLSVQTSSAAGLFQVNSNVTEYASDAGAEVYGASTTTFPTNTWAAINGSTVTRYTTAGNYIATGQGSASVQTSITQYSGVTNTLVNTSGTPTALTANNHYNVSFTARLDAAYSNFTTLNVYYSINGSAQSVTCATGQTVPTSIWTKINCNFTAPSSGITSSNAILIEQSDTTVRKFYVDNISVTIAADYNLATDGGVDDNTNFGTNWPGVGLTPVRDTGVGNDTSDSVRVPATGANQGVRNKLSINPQASTAGVLYRITVYATTAVTGFNTFTVRYSPDNGSTFKNCVDYNTQAITQSASLTSFTKITCYITTDNTTVTTPYVYFTQTDATARTWYVDTFSMTLASSSTPNVQIGSGSNGGPTTLFTVDKGASAPIAANNDAFLGSMYYDTTLGKLQCYEADGWGACGSSPDNIITISPEYTNAVLHGTGIGTMTSDICSSSLGINDGSGTPAQPTICGTGETYNFYKWTSPQTTNQTYSIYVTYQLPTTFKSFNSGQTSLMARTDNGPNSGAGAVATVQYTVYRNSGSSLTACGTATTVSTGTVSSWQVKTASGAADPSTCSFVAGNSIVFKIDVTANKNASAYVGNLNFAFSNK